MSVLLRFVNFGINQETEPKALQKMKDEAFFPVSEPHLQEIAVPEIKKYTPEFRVGIVFKPLITANLHGVPVFIGFNGFCVHLL
ncbi:hypothetical protein D9M70_643730 [compost metagenome]